MGNMIVSMDMVGNGEMTQNSMFWWKIKIYEFCYYGSCLWWVIRGGIL